MKEENKPIKKIKCVFDPIEPLGPEFDELSKRLEMQFKANNDPEFPFGTHFIEEMFGPLK